MGTLLEIENMTKRFGGTLALNDVSISIATHKIHALLGENGAGKSTLIKILAGVYTKDSGTIKFQGEVIEDPKTLQRSKEIAFIHQDLGLVEWMTVAENISLTVGYPKKPLLRRIDWKQNRIQAIQVLEKMEISIDPDERIMNLSRAEKSLIAISKAISLNAKLIFLDEPTASLPAKDVEHLFGVLRTLKEKGLAIVLVSHRLDEVFEVCDEVVVLRDGTLVGTDKVNDLDENKLINLIVGDKKASMLTRASPKMGNVVLEVDSVLLDDVGPISFTISEGEVLALSGLRGAGQEIVSRILFSDLTKTEGKIFINNKEFTATNPAEAISQGISLLSKDRIGESICTTMNVAENLYLNPTNHGYTKLFYSVKQETFNSKVKIQKFNVRPQKTDIDISSLSGGNQQKVILARWFDIATPVLILEDPTQGVDVGAKVEIYNFIDEFVTQGGAVILMSTDYEEIVTISQRALIFSKGRLVKELFEDDLNINNLLYYASAYDEVSNE